jgi:hypothetical protein
MSERTSEYALLALDSYTSNAVGKELIRGGRPYEVIDAAGDPLTGF